MEFHKNISYNNLQKELKLSKKIMTNFIPSKELEEEIENNSNYFFKEEENWILLTEVSDFFKMYFSIYRCEGELFKETLLCSEDFLRVASTVEIVCEYVSKKEELVEVNTFLEVLGFSRLVKRERLRLDSFSLDNPKDHEVIFLKRKWAENLLNLYYETFDRYTSLIPTLEELREALDNHRVLGVVTDDKRLAGVLEFDESSKLTSILKLIVLDEFRGRGYASKLLHQYLFEVVTKKGLKANLWVRWDNVPAKRLYLGNGYKEEKLYSVAYIRRD